MTANMWAVYLLLNDAKTRSYVGATVDPNRRLRQHNGELVGGARATAGDHWTRVCLVRGFPDERAALQFEWMWKHLTRKMKPASPLERRYKALQMLVALGKSSRTSTPFSSWPSPLIIEKQGEKPSSATQPSATIQPSNNIQTTPSIDFFLRLH